MAQSAGFPDNGFPYQFPEPDMAVPEDADPVQTGNPFDASMMPTVSAASEPWTDKFNEPQTDDLFEMP